MWLCELAANLIVHQDFAITGMPITIEVFTNRLVLTNPGACLNDVNRLIDLPPHSRNEEMAQLMLQLDMCERFGLDAKGTAMVSHIITDTLESGLIKLENPEMTSRRYATYLPYYG